MGNPARRPTAERREQIAQAALHILSTQGATRLTAKELGRSVGITDGALFRHFPDKAAILDAAVALFEAELAVPRSVGEPPLARLKAFFIARVSRVQARPEILGLAFNDRLQDVVGPDAAARVRAVIRRSVAFVRRCVRDAQAEGALSPALSADVVTWMITGAMRGAAATRRPPEKMWGEVERVLGLSAGGGA